MLDEDVHCVQCDLLKKREESSVWCGDSKRKRCLSL